MCHPALPSPPMYFYPGLSWCGQRVDQKLLKVLSGLELAVTSGQGQEWSSRHSSSLDPGLLDGTL